MDTRVKPAYDAFAMSGSLPAQKLTRLVERAERNAGLCEIFRRTFLAVDHGEHQHDLTAGVAHRIGGLDGGAAGGGDILDNDDALALQPLTLRQSLDRKAGAVLFRFL